METRDDMAGKLRMQADLGRTRLGRDLGEGMGDVTKSTVVWLEDGAQEQKQVADCKGCGFISSSENFPNGCPNCGCHDFELSDV
jgi:hypothetical protein